MRDKWICEYSSQYFRQKYNPRTGTIGFVRTVEPVRHIVMAPSKPAIYDGDWHPAEAMK